MSDESPANTTIASKSAYHSHSLWGKVFIRKYNNDERSCKVGFESYHFVSADGEGESGAYLSFEHSDYDDSELGDGSALPRRVPFSSQSFDEEKRIFRGSIPWIDSYNALFCGDKAWHVEMTFDEKFLSIQSGQWVYEVMNGEDEKEYFGKDFNYHSINMSITINPTYHSDSLWGNVFIRYGYHYGRVGLESYHFISADNEGESGAYVSFEHSNYRDEDGNCNFELDDGSRMPQRVPFSSQSFDAEKRIFCGSISWIDAFNTSNEEYKAWHFEMIFDEQFRSIQSGHLLMEGISGKEDLKRPFGNPHGNLCYYNAAKECTKEGEWYVYFGGFKGVLMYAVKLKVKDTVTELPDHVFYRYNSMQQINIPSSVQTIGKWAFDGCSSLASIDLSKASLTVIRKSTFIKCTSLCSVKLPKILTTIDEYAFKECRSLSAINIPTTVTTVGKEAFAQCQSLSTVQIAPSVNIEMGDAFIKCLLLDKDPFITFNIVTTRFQDYPLHSHCYDVNITITSLKELIDTDREQTKKIDTFGCTALHILASNPYATPEMFKLLFDANREAATIKDNRGRIPLHWACENPHLSLTLEFLSVKMDSGSYGSSVLDDKSDSPPMLAIRSISEDKHLMYLVQPVVRTQFNENYQKNIVKELEKQRLTNFHDESNNLDGWKPVQKHGLVTFLSYIHDEKVKKDWVDFIKNSDCSKEVIQIFSQFTDSNGRSIADSATNGIREAIKDRIYFDKLKDEIQELKDENLELKNTLKRKEENDQPVSRKKNRVGKFFMKFIK